MNNMLVTLRVLVMAALFASTAALCSQAQQTQVPAHFNASIPLRIYKGAGVDISKPYNQAGIDAIRSQPTGFFHAKRIDDVWWLIDPNGHGYWHAGMLGMKFGKFGFGKGSEEERTGRKAVFQTADSYVRHCTEALDGGGFNGTGNWANDPLAGPKAFVRQLNQRGFHRWQETGNMPYKLTEGPGWHDVSNPFHPAFPAWCDREAELQCSPLKNSPWLIGYQLANELNWFGADLAAMVMRYPADHHAKLALARFAGKHFGDIDRFNAAWGTAHESFTDIVSSGSVPNVPPTPEAIGFAWAFAEHCLDVFLTHWAGAVRRHDPNHMILGIRQHTHQTPGRFSRNWWKIMGKHCDVISINAYAANSQVDPKRGVPSTMSAHFDELSRVTGRPLLNSEWYPNVDEVPVFRIYQSFMISHPAFVGSQFFNWAGHDDLSYTIRAGDGKSTFRPKPELETVAAEVHGQIASLRLEGKLERFTFHPDAARQWAHSLPPRRKEPVQLPLTMGSLTVEHLRDGYRVRSKGEFFQDFRPMIHQKFNGENRYLRGAEHALTAFYEDGEFLVIDSVLEHPGSSGKLARSGAADNELLTYACRFSIRVWIPKKADGVFVSQLLGVENRSQASWLCNWVAQACETRLGETGKDDLPVNILSVHLGGGWIDPDKDLGYFSFAPDLRTEGKFIIFKSNGRRAPGRRENLGLILVGAQSWSPDTPATVVHMRWKPSDGASALQERVDALVGSWFTPAQPAAFVSRMVD